MAYTPSTTFVTGNQLNAPELTGNQGGARDYINSGTLTADLSTDTFDTKDLARGRPVLVTLDQEFTTGDVYIQSELSEVSTERRYVLGTAKKPSIVESQVGASLTAVSEFFAIPGAARRLFLQNASDVIVECTAFAKGMPTNNQGALKRAYFEDTTPSPGAVNSNVYVAIDGVVKPNSVCFVFAEDKDFNTVTPGTNFPSSQSRLEHYDLGGSKQSTGGFPEESALRRPLYIYWAESNMSVGWHSIQLVCDPRYERLFVSALSMQIEVLSDGGRTTWDGDSYLVFNS